MWNKKYGIRTEALPETDCPKWRCAAWSDVKPFARNRPHSMAKMKATAKLIGQKGGRERLYVFLLICSFKILLRITSRSFTNRNENRINMAINPKENGFRLLQSFPYPRKTHKILCKAAEGYDITIFIAALYEINQMCSLSRSR